MLLKNEKKPLPNSSISPLGLIEKSPGSLERPPKDFPVRYGSKLISDPRTPPFRPSLPPRKSTQSPQLLQMELTYRLIKKNCLFMAPTKRLCEVAPIWLIPNGTPQIIAREKGDYR